MNIKGVAIEMPLPFVAHSTPVTHWFATLCSSFYRASRGWSRAEQSRADPWNKDFTHIL